MKKILSLTAVIAFAVLVSACGGNATDKAKNAISNATGQLSMDEMVEEMEKISKQVEEGKITGSEASELMKKLQAKSETQAQSLSKTVSNISEFDGIPSWAKKLGAPEVKGLKLDPANSTIVKSGNGYTQHFNAAYTGDKDKLFAEARRIGKELGLKVATDLPTMLLLEGDLTDGYRSNVQAMYEKGSDAKLLYGVYAEIVNSVKKPSSK